MKRAALILFAATVLVAGCAADGVLLGDCRRWADGRVLPSDIAEYCARRDRSVRGI